MQLNGVRSELKRGGARVRVTVHEAKGLYPTSKAGTTDAHVVIGLWTPTSGHKKGKMDQKKGQVERTSEKPGTINPAWNEERIFDVPDLPSVLDNMYILLEVWEKDKKYLGWAEVHMPAVANTQTHMLALPLQKRKPKDTVAGELRVSVAVAATHPVTKIEMQEEPLSQLPVFFVDSFWLPYYLQEFYMVKCGLTALSPRVGRWQALRSLVLAENQLKALPDETYQLVNLEELDVSYNMLTAVSKHIANLKKLKVLNIAKNPIQSFEWETGLAPGCQVKGKEIKAP